jgi:hypothetical protein
VTVRNQGAGDLFKVAVLIDWGTLEDAKGERRTFVVDLPARGSAEVKLRTTFPRGYGAVSVMALQLTDHAPIDSFTSDPTPENGCAFRIVNPQLLPARYLAARAEAGGCRGK